MTIREYEMRMEAFRLGMVDRDYYIHWQAYLNFAVQAERPVGKGRTKPVYNRFDKFYDYEKELKRISGKKKEKSGRFSGIGKLLRKEGT
ncbi:hypothetical protein HGO97_011740 [Faecalicatena sp. AGMB00832]|uniref:Uncharacterized protein n=1 Tax=Faecalicatena faecalis TaxID=2726362 RepID=A0ABS6D4I0_9FIRM|nr:hypothetical protein [Faecalicatena faecalis]MBU3876483.1 hypothetical protein [Faecalicatena faecalis]